MVAIESYLFILMVVIVGEDLSLTEVVKHGVAASVAWDLAYEVLVYNSSSYRYSQATFYFSVCLQCNTIYAAWPGLVL